MGKPDIEVIRNEFEDFISKKSGSPLPVRVIPFEEKGVKGLWFEPEDVSGDKVLLYFHGGGFSVGSPGTAASISSLLSQQAGIKCFSLQYPLAPEFPYPAALDNAVEAYRMLLGKGYKPWNIVLAGDSAGGGLALSVMQCLRALKIPMPAGAYLISPWTDLSNSFAREMAKFKKDDTLSLGLLDMLASMYVNKRDHIKDPYISPAYADLRGFPPLLVHVGSNELLLDDSLIIVRNAAIEDVPVKLMVWPGYFHDFQMFHHSLEGGRKALQDAAKFFGDVMNNSLLQPVNHFAS